MDHELEMKQKAEKTQLGFWIYLMTDAILFATLFATYIILRHNVNNGPSTHDLFSLTFVLVETIILLTSSYTVGLANLALRHGKMREFIGYLAATLALGLAFLAMEFGEFHNIVAEGHTWMDSAFLSGFFTLVGTHGFHVLLGTLWGLTIGWAIHRQGANHDTKRKFSLFSLFWHFLDLVWIFIFTIVYVLGVI